MKSRLPAIAIAALSTSTASARDFCPERPGQTTPPCTVERGRAVVETALASWTLQRDQQSRSDNFSFGQTVLRLGVGSATEVQLGFTPFGTVRTRDADGLVERTGSAGDTTIAIKHAFGNADHPHVAVKAYATVPTGGSSIGQGTWSAGINVPITFDLSDKLAVGLTPEVDAAADADTMGRHLAYGGAASVAVKLGEHGSLTTDIAAFRDHDPIGHSTRVAAGASLAVQPDDRLQVDIGGAAGLTAATPDITVYIGIARAL